MKANELFKMSDKEILDFLNGTDDLEKRKSEQPLKEIEWLLDNYFNGKKSKKEKYAIKINNWLKSHKNMRLSSINFSDELLGSLAKFTNEQYEKNMICSKCKGKVVESNKGLICYSCGNLVQNCVCTFKIYGDVEEGTMSSLTNLFG